MTKDEWDGVRKYKSTVANMDVYEEEFGAIVVSGDEGWSAQTGEASLNSRVDGDDDDEADSVDRDMSVPMETQTAETQTQAGSFRAKKRRKERDVVVEAFAKRTEVLENWNRIVEQMLEREYASSVECVLEILNGLPGVIMWSPFYQAAVEHLLDNEGSRQGFIAFPMAEDKIRFLELRTGTKLDG